MKLDTYNQDGKKIGTYDAPDNLFGLPLNNDLVYQVFRAKISNARKNYAHTKTRAEVRGGGRKPWRQKGTGRARHGSIRSPIWVGGGVTFGPSRDKSYAKKINKKMNSKAIFTVLSSKARNKNIFVIENLDYSEPKTRQGVKLIDKLKINSQTNVIYGVKKDQNFKLVFRNIPRTTPVSIDGLNVVDVLRNSNCIFSKEALDQIVNKYQDKIKGTVLSSKKPATKTA